MSQVPILSFLPTISPLGSHEGSIKIDSNWTNKIFHSQGPNGLNTRRQSKLWPFTILILLPFSNIGEE